MVTNKNTTFLIPGYPFREPLIKVGMPHHYFRHGGVRAEFQKVDIVQHINIYLLNQRFLSYLIDSNRIHTAT